MTRSKNIGTGNNQNSHRNKPKLGKEPTKDEDRVTSRLLPHQKQTAWELGGGNYADGIRKALNICSREYHVENPTKLVTLLTLAQSASEPTKSELIAEALEYLESWSIERSYTEALAEGVIKTPSGAYIV